MAAAMSAVKESATTLLQALSFSPVREFLDLASAVPMPARRRLEVALADLRQRAETASQSEALVDAARKTRPGRGKAVPAGAISAQVFCALVIAECYRHCHDKYPAPRNARASEAADLYWRLSGGKQKAWGNEPLTAWRRHFRNATAPEIAGLPESSTQLNEIRRHLRIRERLAAQAAEPADESASGV
jgi:hypothetical protein